MIVRTFSLYAARRIGTTIALVLATIVGIAHIADITEFLRRFSNHDDFSLFLTLRVTWMRIPFLAEQILPFAVLIGAILSLVSLTRRSELAVARASGISVWGFLRPVLVTVFAIGVAFVAFVNPLASALNDDSRLIESILRGRDISRQNQDVWFRQSGADNLSIIHAAAVDRDPLTLIGMTAVVLDRKGNFREKVAAAAAVFGESGWILDNATVIAAGAPPKVVDRYVLSTSLGVGEIRQILTRPESQSVFTLPQFIETARDSGLKIDRFQYAFHNLLARPFYLMAMVVLAASFCLKMARSGGTGKLVFAGVISGFLLYVLSEFLRDLGGNGIVGAAFAAWTPPVATLTIGATVLLYLEDG